MTNNEGNESKATGSAPWYAGFVVALGVSVDTSWRYFGERLHITGPERVLLFSVVEVMLLASAWSMRAGVRRNGHPGSARAVAWALCAFQAYMAFELSGPAEGFARVVLGSGLALVALHQALGIELKAKGGQRAGTMARIGREMRERALSRLGLADDARDALARTRDRAAERAARLATDPSRVWFRRGRLAKAVRVSGVAVDPIMKERMLAHAAAYGNLGLLMDIELDNPWTTPVQPVLPVPSVPRPRLSVVPTSGGPSIGWDLDKVVRLVLEGRADADVLEHVSVKNLQRVRRVLRQLPGEVAVQGDLTTKFVQSVRAAYEKAMSE
jgi:hypothetical protein